MNKIFYIVLAVCFLNSCFYAYSKNISDAVVSENKDRHSVEEMKKIMHQYVSVNSDDSLWQCSLMYEKAMELGVSDSVYHDLKNQMEEMNNHIVELRNKGIEVIVSNGGDTLFYRQGVISSKR